MPAGRTTPSPGPSTASSRPITSRRGPSSTNVIWSSSWKCGGRATSRPRTMPSSITPPVVGRQYRNEQPDGGTSCVRDEEREKDMSYQRAILHDASCSCSRPQKVLWFCENGDEERANMVKFRVARPTDNLPEIVRFYRDGLGLEVLTSFENHDGFDGVMLGHKGV